MRPLSQSPPSTLPKTEIISTVFTLTENEDNDKEQKAFGVVKELEIAWSEFSPSIS